MYRYEAKPCKLLVPLVPSSLEFMDLHPEKSHPFVEAAPRESMGLRPWLPVF